MTNPLRDGKNQNEIKSLVHTYFFKEPRVKQTEILRIALLTSLEA